MVDLAEVVRAGATVKVVLTDGLELGPTPIDWLRLAPAAHQSLPAELSFLWLGMHEQVHSLKVVDVVIEQDPAEWVYRAEGGERITVEPTWRPSDDVALRQWKALRSLDRPEPGGWRFGDATV